MIERLNLYGVSELTRAEQGEVLGGDNDIGWLLGAAAGVIAGGAANAFDAIIRALSQMEYDNPRHSGTWQG